MILSAVNFLTILFFVPETRYKREVGQTSVGGGTSNERIVMGDEKSSQGSSTALSLNQLPKNTWLKEFSLWSGASETSLVKMFVR